jgi:hypothetical protein
MELIQVDGKFYRKSDVLEALANIIEQKTFNDGVAFALETLKDVYGEGIEETDLWSEYM